MLGDNDFGAAFVEILDNPIRIECLVSDRPVKVDVLDRGVHAHSIEAVSR